MPKPKSTLAKQIAELEIAVPKGRVYGYVNVEDVRLIRKQILIQRRMESTKVRARVDRKRVKTG